MALELRPAGNTLFLPALLLIFLVLSLFSLAGLLLSMTAMAEWYIHLLSFNVFFLVVSGVLIGLQFWRFRKNIVGKQAGDRLSMRLTRHFIAFALVPAVVVYLFSVLSLREGINAWLSADVESGLEDALVLGRLSLDTQLENYRRQTEPLLEELENTPSEIASYILRELLSKSDAEEMTLFDGNQQIVASASKDMDRPLADFPADSVLQAINEEESYIGLEPSPDGGLYARLVYVLPSYEALAEERVFQALFPASERMDALAGNVQNVYRNYRKVIYERDILETQINIVLTLVFLLGGACAVWFSFSFAGRLSEPVTALSSATRAVASGRLDLRVESSSRDELGQLVNSFNTMTNHLAQTRESMKKSQEQLQQKHSYIKTVLEQVSSGVMSLDRDLCLVTCNQAAGDMLRLPLTEYLNKPLAPAAQRSAVVKALCGWLQAAHDDKERAEWEHQYNGPLENEHATFMFRIANLPGEGYVVVCNNITQIVQAQRNKTWSEAAQRMAHEIKNPLTPIQLASERLGKKLSANLSGPQQELLARYTQTIINQVEGMRAMLNEFSQYAKSDTRLAFSPAPINAIVSEVAELYRNGPARIDLNLAPERPLVSGDASRLRQLLHNLLKNANEAFTAENASPRITITASIDKNQRAGFDQVALKVTDNGPGFDRRVLEHLFDPYMTTKRGGNGLGLAIVKKIVEEHGGLIRVQNIRGGGASIIISLLRADSGSVRKKSVEAT